MLKIVEQAVSLDTPIGQDADATIGDMFEDQPAAWPAQAAIQARLRAAINDS
jgi:RNA polymerase primary sigma factor